MSQNCSAEGVTGLPVSSHLHYWKLWARKWSFQRNHPVSCHIVRNLTLIPQGSQNVAIKIETNAETDGRGCAVHPHLRNQKFLFCYLVRMLVPGLKSAVKKNTDIHHQLYCRQLLFPISFTARARLTSHWHLPSGCLDHRNNIYKFLEWLAFPFDVKWSAVCLPEQDSWFTI